jgi:hypothetical protein
MPHATKTSSVDVNINSSQSSRQNKSALPAFTASRSEATNTHTHTHTHTPKVQHRHEKQPKSSPPRHEVCSTQPVKTRDRTQQTTSNQEPNPQIKLPRVCPGFPRREKRIRDPQHFTLSHHRKSAKSSSTFRTRTPDDQSATSPFENATRNRRIFRYYGC